jgi:hypothetical protein
VIAQISILILAQMLVGAATSGKTAVVKLMIDARVALGTTDEVSL